MGDQLTPGYSFGFDRPGLRLHPHADSPAYGYQIWLSLAVALRGRARDCCVADAPHLPARQMTAC